MQSSMDATEVLTPSEVVLLNGDRFSRLDKNGFPIPRGETKVEPGALAVKALAAALLANERAGTLRLEPGIEKKFFGLFKSKVVRLYPGAAAPEWPTGSYEARIHETVKAHAGTEGVTVSSMVYNLFAADDPGPSVEVLLQIAAALRSRGLAEEETRETRSLKIFKTKSTVSVLNSTGEALAARHPTAPVEELLSGWERDRAEVWKLVEAGINSGLASRREADRDYDSGSSFD